MSNYKFNLINSNRAVINRVKNDLWGFILLTKKNKYKQLYTKLYDKRKRRFHYYIKRKRIKRYTVISKNKVFYIKKYTKFYNERKNLLKKVYFAKLNKFLKKKNIKFPVFKKKLNYFFSFINFNFFNKIKFLNFLKIKKIKKPNKSFFLLLKAAKKFVKKKKFTKAT